MKSKAFKKLISIPLIGCLVAFLNGCESGSSDSNDELPEETAQSTNQVDEAVLPPSAPEPQADPDPPAPPVPSPQPEPEEEPDPPAGPGVGGG